MRVFYGIQLHGQGHLNRAAELVRRLRAGGHHVTPMTSGNRPPAYARDLLGDFEHVPASSFSLADGRLDVARTAARLAGLLPRRLAAAASLARELARQRADLVLSDFEPISAWAAGAARVPSAGIAAQFRITHTDAPPAGPRRERLPPELTIRACAIGLDRLFAVSFAPLRPTDPRARVVGPIVDARVRDLRPTRGGFFVAYLYSYERERVRAALSGLGAFRIYGLDRDERDGDLWFRPTDRATFLADLAACEGVILNGSFQAVCEAAVLGKPVLSIPFADHYEERFCAAEVERARLGRRGARLARETVRAFVHDPRPPAPPAMGDGADQVLQELGL